MCRIICDDLHRLFYTPKNSAPKIDFSNVEKISFYILIYDNTQFILQSPAFGIYRILLHNRLHQYLIPHLYISYPDFFRLIKTEAQHIPNVQMIVIQIIRYYICSFPVPGFCLYIVISVSIRISGCPSLTNWLLFCKAD